MAISLITVEIRHERRVRLLFSNTLALAAFASTSFYTVTEIDGVAANPGVVVAMLVPDSPHAVELQLDTDLVQGARYRFSAVGVPAVDASVTPDPSDACATIATERAPAALGAGGVVTEIDKALFGVDLAFGDDFLETPDGDLATVGGMAVAQADIQRAALADGLPWDPSYGLHARQEVDGAPQALVGLRGRAIAMMRGDDRIVAAEAELDLADETAPSVILRPTFIGARGTPQAPVRAPFSSDR